MRYIAAILLAIVIAGAGYVFGARSAQTAKPTVDLSITDGGIYRVRKVVDGDTVVLENGVHIRYLGVGAPETGHFVKDKAPMADESTRRNVELVEGKQVRLRLGREPLDMYGRILAQVIIMNDGSPETEAGRVLVEEGLARPMGLGIGKEELQQLKILEDSARAAKRGIWSLEEQASKASPDGKPYCGSSTKPASIYHLLMCPSAKRIKAENRHYYSSIDEAEAAGRNACSKCVPK